MHCSNDCEGGAAAPVVSGNGSTSRVPILHLGVIGPLHRRDIYDGVRCSSGTRYKRVN